MMILADKAARNITISQMAAAIHHKDAIKQFFEIVRGRRDLEPTALQINRAKESPKTRDLSQILKHDIQVISGFSRKTAFHDFVTRLYQIRLAQHAEEMRQNRDRIRRGDIKKILQGTGMTERQYFHHRDKGKKWRKYCQRFPGILGFILFQTYGLKFSSTDWLHLDDADFDSLRLHLDTEYISAICSAGKLFEKTLDPTTDDIEFIGEG